MLYQETDMEIYGKFTFTSPGPFSYELIYLPRLLCEGKLISKLQVVVELKETRVLI
jgi:hypothetical protein